MVVDIEQIRENINRQFELMETEIGIDVSAVSMHKSGVDLRDAFNERLDDITDLMYREEINPEFVCNINRDDDNEFDVDFKPKILFFPFAGNPPHWAHLLTALDAMVLEKFDRVVFVSGGNDPRKSSLIDVEARYEMIRDVIALFGGLFSFSDIGEFPIMDESLPLISEYTLFKFLKLNSTLPFEAFYFAGSDHLHRSVVRDGKEVLDTLGILEESVERKLLDFDSEVHGVNALFNARDNIEFTQGLDEVGESFIRIHRLDPTVSSSSTSIRIVFGEGADRDALVFLPYVSYVKIKANGWY
ncbi:MAG: hypothetical protein ACI83O_000211 [Patescibacteria group bacterium]|jgi:hypothetical protein